MARDIQKETVRGRGVRHSREDMLARAREATEADPVSVVTYTPAEAERRERLRRNAEALRDAMHSRELAALRRKWAADNAREREIRLGLEKLARRMIRAGMLERSAANDSEEIVTSVGSSNASLPDEQPFELTRRIVRGKRRIPALGNFFKAVNIFVCSGVSGNVY